MADLQDLARLQTEAVNQHTTRIDQLSTSDMCRVINQEDLLVAPSISPCIPRIAAAIDALTPRVRRGGRVIYVGAGTSGRLGILDASEIPPTFAAPHDQFIGLIAGGDAAIRRAQEGAEDSTAAGETDMASLSLQGDLDSVIGIAASGRTPYVLGCLAFAKAAGCVTIGVACADPSTMSVSGDVDFLISPLPGPEVVTGSTRLKAGTATKLVLNMLSTGVMIRVGKTYGNAEMVDMVASNAKLRQRSRNMLRRLSAECALLADDHLDALLERCDQSVKLALLVAETGLPVDECRETLQVVDGRLSLALERTVPSTHTAQGAESSCDLVMCIDGGGTKCAAIIADHSGAVLARGVAGPCNVADGHSLDDAVKTLTAAAQSAVNNLPNTAARPRLAQFQSIWVGLAGMDRPGFADALRRLISHAFDLPATNQVLRLSNDVDLLAAAMTQHPDISSAIVLIAGTGGVAMRYNIRSPGQKPERVARSGGWGHILGDQGGGYVIGLNAITHTLAYMEEIQLGIRSDPPGRFENAVLDRLGVTSGQSSTDVLSAVLVGAQGSTKSRIAAVAPVVLELASTDDPRALAIVSAQVAELVDKTLGRLVDSRCTSAVAVEETGLVLSGGVLNHQTYRDLVLQRLSEQGLRFAYVHTVEDAGATAVGYLARS